MEDLLIKAGLNASQARLYLYLLDHGELTPPAIAKSLDITRPNAYKVLERLEELGLVQRLETNKKIAYRAADPSALASLAAEERNRAIALEYTVNDAMQQLRAKYRKSTQPGKLSMGRGRQAIKEAFEHQAAQVRSIYFVKSRADVPFLGFEAMRRIRVLPARHRTDRFGITPVGPDTPRQPNIDARSRLTRTLIPSQGYTTPVEWTVAGDELLILVFEGEGYYIRIQDATVAQAFEQLWKLMDVNIRANPNYMTYGSKAEREV